MPQPKPGTDNRYCTFTVAGLSFGLDVLKVQEVLRWQEMTPVPLAPRVVSGLLNLRGQVVRLRKLAFVFDDTPSPGERHVDDRIDDYVGNVYTLRPQITRQRFGQDALCGFCRRPSDIVRFASQRGRIAGHND